MRTAALPYLEDDVAEIRRAAAVACCQLFAKDPICYQTSSHAIEVLSDVLNKLLTVGIADPGSHLLCSSATSYYNVIDSITRKVVLEALQPPFDRHLAQAQNVRSMFIVLNDESIENRMLAVELIGRMSVYNPAYVCPDSSYVIFVRSAHLRLGGTIVAEIAYSAPD